MNLNLLHNVLNFLIAVMGGLQPMLSACTCGLAVPQAAAEEKVEAKSCCSGCCSTSDASESEASACCDAANSGTHGCDDCHCCVAAEKSPLLPTTTSLQDDLQSSPFANVAIIPNAFHSGLNGVAWQNAFDLISPGGPPGIRLHALLSVWRN